jgi:hypothetical protein
MGFAELIERLQTLPEAKRAEVFDFVEFLANRNPAAPEVEKTLAHSSLAEFMKSPLTVDEFTPLSRDEAHER